MDIDKAFLSWCESKGLELGTMELEAVLDAQDRFRAETKGEARTRKNEARTVTVILTVPSGEDEILRAFPYSNVPNKPRAKDAAAATLALRAQAAGLDTSAATVYVVPSAE